jgi:hypothetical protein
MAAPVTITQLFVEHPLTTIPDTALFEVEGDFGSGVQNGATTFANLRTQLMKAPGTIGGTTPGAATVTNLTATGTTTLASLSAAGTSLTSLSVSGATVLAGLTVSSFTCTGTTSFVNVTGSGIGAFNILSVTDKATSRNNLGIKYTPVALTVVSTTATLDATGLMEVFGTVTLTGNWTLAITAPTSGLRGTIYVKQDATGGRTFALPAGSKVVDGGAGAIALSTSANAIDVLSFVYDGTNYFWFYGKNFS